MASDGRIDALARAIREIRRASRNPKIGVLVGGQAFTEQPELTALVGADATATDGQQAVAEGGDASGAAGPGVVTSYRPP